MGTFDQLGATSRPSTGLRVGDRVRVKAGVEHNKMTANAVGTIAIVNGTAIGIRFDGMAGVHKWYVAEELEPANDTARNPGKRMR